jgi:predicted RNA-binding Zn-ribbon protein involved in translation (DUF1610 family)
MARCFICGNTIQETKEKAVTRNCPNCGKARVVHNHCCSTLSDAKCFECRGEGSSSSKQASFFKGEKLKFLKYKPSTDLGHFDVHLDLSTGKMEVVVSMAFSYQPKFYALTGKGKSPPQHDVKVITDFYKRAEEIIPKIWDNAFVFQFKKSGYSEITVRPTFTVKMVDMKSEPHYAVELSDASEQWYNKAIVTEAPEEGSTTTAHYATFTNDVVITPTGLKDRVKFVVRDLVHGYKLPFVDYDAVRANAALLKPPSDEHEQWKNEIEKRTDKSGSSDLALARKQLQEFARTLTILTSEMDDNLILSNLIIRVEIERAFGHGEIRTLVKEICNDWRWLVSFQLVALTPMTAGLLTTRGTAHIRLLSNRLDASAPESAHADAIANLCFSALEKKSPIFANRGFNQYVIAHEFGHMLGLPDEYVCLVEESRDLVGSMDFICEPDKFSSETWYEFQRPETGIFLKAKATKTNQVKFLELCRRAGMEAPIFGRKTPSLMSAGTELHAYHALTLWECLCKMTKTDDWKITCMR